MTTYATDSYSGVTITNQLQDCKADVTYLTRSDWEGTFPTHDGEAGTQISTWGNEINGKDGVSYTYVKTASDDLIAELDSFQAVQMLRRRHLQTHRLSMVQIMD